MTYDDQSEMRGLDPSEAVVAAEMAVLGAMIQSARAVDAASEILKPGDFYKSAHRIVAEAIGFLYERGNPVDPVSVLKQITDLGDASRVDGVTLHTLMAHAATDASYAARIVANDAIRRETFQALISSEQIARRPDFDAETDVDLIRERLDAATSRVTGDTPPLLGEIIIRRLDDLERPIAADTFVPTPYMDLTSLTSGLRPGQVIVVGARPSVGKTTIATDFARCAAIKHGMPTLFFSMEMSEDELGDRFLAAEARVSLQSIREHRLTPEEWDRIGRKQEGILNAPLVIDDSAHCTLGKVRGRLRGMARTDPARLVILDYIGLMQPPKADSRERQVAELSRGLKLLAKEFKVPILALSQLNRESTKRNDKRPTMSDLRDSGAIEQDADMVILLHREDAYDKYSPRAGELDLIVDKHRNGPIATITVAYQGHYGRAADLAPDPPTAQRGHLAAVPD